MLRLVAGSAVLLVALHAPDATAGQCEAMLEFVNNSTSKNFSDLTPRDIAEARFCSAKYSRGQAGRPNEIEAQYRILTGNYSASDDQIVDHQQELCGGRFGTEYINQAGMKETINLAAGTADALNACYNRTGLVLDDLIEKNGSFTAVVSWHGPDPRPFLGVQGQVGTDKERRAVCSFVYDGVQYQKDGSDLLTPITVQPDDPITVSCNRVIKVTNSPAGATELYPGGVISITGENAVAIPLVEIRLPRRSARNNCRASEIKLDVSNYQPHETSRVCNEWSDRLVCAAATNHPVKSAIYRINLPNERICNATSWSVGMKYASAQPRPVGITINDLLARTNEFAKPTGSWSSTSRFQSASTWPGNALKAGLNEIMISADGNLPHIEEIYLTPAF